MIKLEKLVRVFSKDTRASMKEDLMSILGVPTVDGGGGQVKKRRSSSSQRKDMEKTSIQGWLAKRLSQARRVVMIKSVIQAIPTYVINCFKIPKALLTEIESMIAALF
ncbi:UNVERIFIED_CONTAM: hypothetical protein Sindi_0981200 [Sesamum indicum]